jgi:hypothetical protein
MEMNDSEFEAWQKILDEWRKLDRLRRLNQRLYDYLVSSMIYLIEYSKRNDIVLPHKVKNVVLAYMNHLKVKLGQTFSGLLSLLTIDC